MIPLARQHGGQFQAQKIGDIGRIDWFKTGRIQDLRESQWTPLGAKYSMKVQSDLMQLQLHVSLDLKKIYRKALIIIGLTFFVVSSFLSYEIFIDVSPIFSRSLSRILYLSCFPFIFIAKYFLQLLVFQKIQKGIELLNDKLKNEGVKVYLRLKDQSCCKKYFQYQWLLFNYVQVFHLNEPEKLQLKYHVPLEFSTLNETFA